MNASAGLKSLRLGVLALAIVGVGAVAFLPAAPALGESATSAGTNEAPDRLILKSGTTVNGKIIEETDQTITFLIIHKGMKATTTYKKSEIEQIKRGINADVRAEALPETKPASKAEPKEEAPKEPDVAADEDPNQTRLYVINMEGFFGFEVAMTPARKAFEEADKYFDDLVPGVGEMAGKMVVDTTKRDRNIIVIKMDTTPAQEGDTIILAEDKVPLLKEQIVGKGRRVVFWIKTALGGAAMLPWISSEIYFTPDGRLGNTQDLDKFNIGDKMVNEKQISLRIGHAHGFAIKGGHGDQIPVINAMFRTQFWLCVKFEGGKPIYLERKPEPSDGDGWVILSDDGEGENKDKSALKGNDLFVLEADWAMKLGIAQGIAETVDDLAFKLGVQRNYIEVGEKENKGNKVMAEWKKKINDTVDLIYPEETERRPQGKLWKEFNDIKVTGTFNERKRDRGRKLAILNQIRSLVQQYKEVFDPEGQWTAQLDVEINKLKLDAEQDARNQRRSGENPDGSDGN